MEVTQDNFEAVFANLTEVIENAQFFTIDTEFTGLKVEGASNINYFDTLEDLYLRDKQRVEAFIAIQVGLVAFFYDEETDKYTHVAYSFYIYPSSYTNVNFTCQSASIKFLNSCGFDFNKLFNKGIPYLRQDEVDALEKKLKEKHEKNYSFENSFKMNIPEEHKSTISDLLEKVNEILKTDSKTTFKTERHNSFIRKLIYNKFFQEFNSRVFLETNKDDTITVSVGFSPEEIKKKREENFLKEKKEILDEVGFTKVVNLLMESKKMIIGHNVFLDLLFIIKQFLAPLPDNYKEFKELVTSIFSKVIDTKYMAASEMKDVKDTGLSNLFQHLSKMKAVPEVNVKENGIGCKVTDEKFHEASFDAYVTGLCFLAMAKCLGNANSVSNVYKNLPDSPLLESVLNKLSIPKLHDIFFLNLAQTDIEPDRTGIYHLTFPREWTRENISDLFSNYGLLQISWINSTTAYIKVKNECVEKVERNLKTPNSEYKLLSHKEFKNLNHNSSDQLLSPLIEKILGKQNKKVTNCQSPTESNSSGGVKRKKCDEDIGEVIERPQKRLQSVSNSDQI